MRGHGATVCASTVQLAVYRAIYTQINARILLSLSTLTGHRSEVGNVQYLSEQEADTAKKSIESQVQRAWGVWKAEIGQEVEGWDGC